MTIPISELFRVYRSELRLGLFAAAVIAAFVLKKLLNIRFAAKATKWPVVRATIENVFVDVENEYKGGITHAVLGYGYSIADSSYSGQIRLSAGGPSVESLERTMIGQEISVQYDPKRPGVSIFLKHKVRGWEVVKDARLSIWSWVDNLF